MAGVREFFAALHGGPLDAEADDLAEGPGAWSPADALCSLSDYRPRIGVCANHRQVGLRHWMEVQGFGDPWRHKSPPQVEEEMANVGQQVLEACGAAGLLPLSPLADHPSVSSSLTSQLTSQADTRPPSTHTPPNTPSILILCAWACQSRNGTWGPVPRRGSGVPEVSSLQWPGSGCLVRASWQQRWSKPAPGMLQAAMEAAGATSSAIYKRALAISQGLPDPLVTTVHNLLHLP